MHDLDQNNKPLSDNSQNTSENTQPIQDSKNLITEENSKKKSVTTGHEAPVDGNVDSSNSNEKNSSVLDSSPSDSENQSESIPDHNSTASSSQVETSNNGVQEEKQASDLDNTTVEASEKSEPNLFDSLLTEAEKLWNEIDAKGNIFTKNESGITHRKLAEVNKDTAEAIVNKLREQYQSIKNQIDDLLAKINVEQDNLPKHLEDIDKNLNYLDKVDAIGNLNALKSALEDSKAKAMKQHENHVTLKKQLLDKFHEFLKQPIDNLKTSDQQSKNFLHEWSQVGHILPEINNKLQDELKLIQDAYTVHRREKLQSLEYEYMNNLDRKREIIEKAKQIAESDNWREGHNQMQSLFDQWKSIGRVPNDQIEIIWQQFKEAKDTFYDRKKKHYDELFSNLEENLEKKLHLIEQIESLKDSEDWNNTTKKIEELDKEFSEIGRVPEDKNKELLDRLHEAKRHFFGNKKEHYKNKNSEFEKNFLIKKDLANKAEALINSTRWKETTAELNKLFDEWKSSGSTFRSKDQMAWKQFITARKAFFKRKDDHFNELNKKHFKENILKVDKVKEEIESLKESIKEDEETLKMVQENFLKETNDRFKSKIKETLDVLEPKIISVKKEIKKKTEWVKRTLDDIAKAEKSLEEAKQKGAFVEGGLAKSDSEGQSEENTKSKTEKTNGLQSNDDKGNQTNVASQSDASQLSDDVPSPDKENSISEAVVDKKKTEGEGNPENSNSSTPPLSEL